MIAISFFLFLGCSSQEVPEQKYVSNKNQLPVAAVHYLPAHGMVMVSNGLEQQAERIVVDFEAGIIKWCQAESKSISAWSKMDTDTRKLSPGELHLLKRLWTEAIDEKPIMNKKHQMGYEEILILVKGQDARTIRGLGAINNKSSKDIVETLRLYTNLDKVRTEVPKKSTEKESTLEKSDTKLQPQGQATPKGQKALNGTPKAPPP